MFFIEMNFWKYHFLPYSSLISIPINPIFEATFKSNPKAARNKLSIQYCGNRKNNRKPIIHKHQDIPDIAPTPSRTTIGNPLAFLLNT